MSFAANVDAKAGEALVVFNDLRGVLRELEIDARAASNNELRAEFQGDAQYDPIKVRFTFPERYGIVAVEGLLLSLAGDPSEELRLAVNFLNQELQGLKLYVQGDSEQSDVVISANLIPTLDSSPTLHPREVQQALMALCAHKAIFAGPLERVQGGHPWRFVRDAMKALK